MAKTRKNKPSKTNVDSSSEGSSKSNESVRAKISGIQEEVGGLGSVIADLNKNNELIKTYTDATAHNTGQTVLNLNDTFQRIFAIDRNVLLLAKHFLDGEGVVSSEAKASSASMKEDEAEKKKEDKLDDEREQRILDYTKMSAEQLKGLTGILKGGSFLDILILGGAVLAGFVTGVVEKIMGFFKPVVALINKVRVLIFGEGTILGKVIAGISKGFTGFIKVIKGISDFIYRFSGMQSIMNVITSGLGKVVGFISGAAKDFFKALQTLGDFFTKIFGKGKGVFSAISNVFSYFDDIFKVIKPVFNIARTLGRTFLKFIPVLGVVMSIFDTVVGAFKGFTETEGTLVDKLIGGLKGGISGLLNGIFGSILDLLKDGVSWVLSSMGFEDAAKSLDSFSFKDLISEAVDSVIEFFMTPVRIVQDIIAAISGDISWSDMFASVMGRIVSAILTPIDYITKKFGFSITEKALELLGLPAANKGAAVSGTDSTGTPTKALEKTTDENLAAKDEQTAKNTGTTIAMNTNNSPVINNNTQSTAIIKAKTTNWEPDDQYARGGMAWGA